MKVIIYEPEKRDMTVCYRVDTLSFSENIINEFDYIFSGAETPELRELMGKLEHPSSVAYEKLDFFLGTIGISDIDVINKGSKIYAFCS